MSENDINDLKHKVQRGPGRSCSQGLLKIPRTKFKTFGDHAFARSGPFVWNKLPREIQNSQSVVILKSKLKTSVQNGLQFVLTFLNSFEMYIYIFFI